MHLFPSKPNARSPLATCPLRLTNLRLINLPLSIFLSALFVSCDAQVNTSPDDTYQRSHPEAFANYWYAGTAEINHFDLTQNRYGEPRDGDAVLIYVTEDFLTKEQVKKESGDGDAVSVLKLNFTKKFITGIYDYSIMTSIFTPVDYMKNPVTLKASFSSQDWCGQSFGQMNMKDGKLNYEVRSYFQAEGDVNTAIDATYLEEDIWTRIRLEPQMLPLGKIKMVPSQEFMRLYHKELEAYDAVAQLMLQVNENRGNNAKELYIYTLKFPDLDRELRIRCESKFPFKVLGWEEILNASTTEKMTVTTATLTETIKNPYWQNNSNKKEALRDSLGLRYEMR